MVAVTFSPTLKNANITLSGGNLVATSAASPTNFFGALGTAFVSSGKYYAELTITAMGTEIILGVGLNSVSLVDGQHPGIGASDSYGYDSFDGQKRRSGTPAAYGASFTTGDKISVLLNMDAGTLTFWKNGVDQGEAYSGLSGAYGIYHSGYASSVVTANFGATAFTYTPPAGYSGWDVPAPTPGNGAMVMESMTAEGSRIAAGAMVMEAMTAVGGMNGRGAMAMQQMTLAGAGGVKTGAMVMEVMTAAGTGSQASGGAMVMQAMTAMGTGSDAAIVTLALTAPAPTVSASIITGTAITVALTAPAPTLFIGTNDLRLTAPAPTIAATLLSGGLIAVVARAPAPILVASGTSPAIITSAVTAPPPRVSITIVGGQILTAALTAPAPLLTAAGLSGNTMTALLTAATPIMAAAGYSAYSITMALTAPAPYLTAYSAEAITANYRTWALNLRTNGLTEYTNFSYNSFTHFNGVNLACSSSGVSVLGTQDTDAGTAITGRFRTGAVDYDDSRLKRLPRAYVKGKFAGDMLYRTVLNESGTRTYSLPWNQAVNAVQRRVPIGRGPKGVSWAHEMENVDGADFTIHALRVYPTVLRRRVQ